MTRKAVLFAACTACYAPNIASEVPCSPSGTCPGGMVCDVDQVCRRAPRERDASPPIDETVLPWDGCVAGESSCGWTVRVRVDIDGKSATPETLTDVTIPLLLTLDRFDLAAAAPDGRDLRITDGVSLLPFEIESWTAVGAIVWVRVPMVSSFAGGATLFVHAGNPAASAPPARSAWGDDYVGVWHLGNPQGTSYPDASRFGFIGTAKGAVNTVTGMLGSASQFSGTSFIDIGAPAELALTTAGTLSAWVRFDAATMFASPIGKTQFGDTPNYSYAFQRNGDAGQQMSLVLSSGNVAREADAAIPTELDVWRDFHGRWDTTIQMFIDGEPSGAATAAVAAQRVDTHLVRIGCSFAPNCTSGGGVAGVIDEVRISRVARSDGWIRFDHAAMTDQVATFAPIERH